MRLNILNLQTGATELDDIAADDTVDKLKARLYESNLVDLLPSGQRLIHSGRTLANGDELLSAAGVAEGDVVVVVKQRGIDDWKKCESSQPGPDIAHISRVMGKAGATMSASSTPSGGTSGLNAKFQGLSVGESAPTSDAQSGEAYATVAMRAGRLEGITLPEPDPDAMATLLDMGFPEARAKKALLLHRNHPGAAMEWLLEVGDGPEADAELTDVEIQQVMSTIGVSQTIFRPPREPAGDPDEADVQRLVEMGFPREEVLAALRATHNNHDAACAWLLGERGSGRMRAMQDMDVGVGARGNPESMQMLLGDILSHPTIQEGMRSERVVQAFQSMIEDPSSAHDYMNDPEVGPILLRVHSILARVADGHGNGDAPARTG
jgi:Kip1 ubiquitination-promoting complex protein 2|mmetsp:Transcript_1318/g.5366  ORF Transcript_1318/g.5366 Transcript_1318/m.5366 type:complete len:379 (-) Transcript_1318:67-1203(-)